MAHGLAREAVDLPRLGGVRARIRVARPALTPVERRIAAALEQRSEELVLLPVEKLAARIDVSESSVVRFCQRLGYRGLRELKLALAADLQGPRPDEAPTAIAPHDPIEHIVRKVTHAAKRALDESVAVLDRGAIARAVDALAAAPRIVLYGVGGSAPIALDAHFRLLRLGLPVAIVTDGHLQSIAASHLGPGMVAFAVSHTGRSRDPFAMLKEARDAGATTILLTSFAGTPIGRWADIQLLAAPTAPSAWVETAPLRVAQLTVIDILCLALANRRGGEAQAAIGRSSAAVADQLLPWSDRHGHATAEAVDGGRRRVAIDGVDNVRHLGGLPLVAGGETAPVLLRGGTLVDITPEGVRQLQELGVRTVVDLRADNERARYPIPNLGGAGIHVVRATMRGPAASSDPDLDDERWAKHYREWLDRSQEAMSLLVRAVADTDGAVLIHCHSGADRTGIASAVLLSLAGCDDESIAGDYVQSMGGRPQAWLIAATLNHLRARWGSAEAYVRAAGVPDAAIVAATTRLRGGPQDDNAVPEPGGS